MYVSINIPEINTYTRGFPDFWLKTLFISGVSKHYQVNALSTMYVRLVEAALVEYSLGHSMIKEFWSTHTAIALGAMHRSVSHFESCLSNMHRAQKCFTRLRRYPDLGELSQALNEPRPEFIHARIADRLRSIRNEIHHTEEMLMDGRVAEGMPLMLRADGPETPHPTEANQTNKSIDRLIVGGRELLFSDLATWLLEMADYCKKISDYVPSSRPENAA